ncbi:MAG: hypothetical protein NVSMB44_17230 [Ktedonobacteraceae bacterium]
MCPEKTRGAVSAYFKRLKSSFTFSLFCRRQKREKVKDDFKRLGKFEMSHYVAIIKNAPRAATFSYTQSKHTKQIYYRT